MGRPATLEAEKKNLLLEMEELKKHTVKKATALKCEIRMLREEIESFKTLLGVEEEFSKKPPKPKPRKRKRANRSPKLSSKRRKRKQSF